MEASQEDEVSAKLLGVPFRVKGINGLTMVLLAAAVAGCMFLLYERSTRGEEQLAAVSQSHAIARDRQTAQMSDEHTAIVQSMRQLQSVNEHIGEAINEQSYLLLADDKERTDIKKRLKRPESLTKKLQRNGD
jgi:hypothetical protein